MKTIELGYGAGAIADYPWHLDGTHPWNFEEAERARECLRALPELGIGMIDTAWRYGGGGGETLVGQMLPLVELGGKKQFVVTKIPLGPVEQMQEKLAQSEGRLGRPPDALLVHDPDLQDWVELPKACKWLCGQQRIPFVGLSSEPSDELVRWYDLHPFTAIEFPCSVWDWRAERMMAHWMRHRKMMRIANRVLGGPMQSNRNLRRALGYIWDCREWVDVALVGTTKEAHLRECAGIFREMGDAV